MIFFDGIHLTSDESVEELNAFAKSMGLRKSWLQHKGNHIHYDATTTRMSRKIEAAGVVLVTKKGIVIACTILRTGGNCKWTREDILSKHRR